MITKERIDTHNLIEIERLIYEGDYTISEIGDQLNMIFFTTDPEGHMTYHNKACSAWLNKEKSSDKETKVTLSQYLDDTVDKMYGVSEPREGNTVNYHLHKVWFPNYLDYRLCMITHVSMTNSDLILYSMVPLQDWEHLNSRLLDLVQEEDFIKEHQQYYKLLTKREKEVVRQISDGLSTREISDQLSISKHTVEQHRKNIKRKLKANTIAKIVKYGRVFSRQNSGHVGS